MSRKSFVIYDNWAVLIRDLPDEKAGELIKAICGYKLGSDYVFSDPAINAIFQMIKVKMDEDAENYEKTCERNRANGSKGGRQRVQNSSERLAVASDRLKSVSGGNPNQADNDNDNDTDNENDNDTDKGNDTKRSRAQRILDLYHSHCPSLPKVLKLTDGRIKAVNARLKEYTEDDLIFAFVKAENSPFLRGERGSWKATFDWLMKPNNLPKVLEGNYDPKGSVDDMLNDWVKGGTNG